MAVTSDTTGQKPTNPIKQILHNPEYILKIISKYFLCICVIR